MFCRNCGRQLGENAYICTNCGTPRGAGANYCPNCGAQVAPSAVICVNCGILLKMGAAVPPGYEQKSKLAAGLLGIFLGGIGVHSFYLGYTGKGVAQIVVTCVTCGIGSLWGFIEGILILCGQITVDANNVPLGE